MSGQFTRDILVPGWVVGFGVASLSAPPAGTAASLTLFVVGVIVIPGLVLLKTIQMMSRDESRAGATAHQDPPSHQTTPSP